MIIMRKFNRVVCTVLTLVVLATTVACGEAEEVNTKPARDERVSCYNDEGKSLSFKVDSSSGKVVLSSDPNVVGGTKGSAVAVMRGNRYICE